MTFSFPVSAVVFEIFALTWFRGCYGERGYDFGCRGDLVAFIARFGAVFCHPFSPLFRSAVSFSEPVIAIVFSVFTVYGVRLSCGYGRRSDNFRCCRLHGCAFVARNRAVFSHPLTPLFRVAMTLAFPVSAVVF